MADAYRHPSEQLQDALFVVEDFIARYLLRRPWPSGDPTEGLQLLDRERRWLDPPKTAQEIEEKERRGRARAEASLFSGIELPLDRAQAAFSLSRLELWLLVSAAAWQIDPIISRAFRFAWNDYHRYEPDLGFLVDLVSRTKEDATALWHRLAKGPLLERGLLSLSERQALPSPPLLHTRVRVDERMLSWLGGGLPESPGCQLIRDPGPKDLVLSPEVQYAISRFPAYLRVSRAEATPILLKGPAGSGRKTIAAKLATDVGAALLYVVIPDEEDLTPHIIRATRDARLFGAMLHLELPAELKPLSSLSYEALRSTGSPVSLGVVEAEPWLHAELGLPPLIDLADLPQDARRTLWIRHAGEHLDEPGLNQIGTLAASGGSNPELIARAVRLAQNQTRWREGKRKASLRLDGLERAVRLQIQHRLHDLADKIDVHGKWEDLVVPERTAEALEEVLTFARHRRQVLDVWGLREKVGYGTGLSVLFSGPPGTGKTFAAGLLAQRLEAELYRIDLSQVVDKYIGETEKRLGKIFAEAERAEAILLFDEADSLFGGRTNVSSSTDRYANLEVNYLLQRMENYEGVTILTTNFESGIDDAFIRRLRFKIDFPAPEEEQRLRLWKTLLPPAAPISDEIDFEAIAEDFELSGGVIKNAVLRAAILAADQSGEITEDLLRDAARRESAEQGHLVRDDYDWGPGP